ncbi:MAG: hypothetical protein EOO02_03690 [Chitinophagaceae bacterium]|nr:MAG: hypothetical protein EOO02_03690 [Chitinophagaceae bacterium]
MCFRSFIVTSVAAFSITGIFTGCKSGDHPDVSGIRVNLETQRFEKDFFTIDTNNIEQGLRKMQSLYPTFFPDFVKGILGLPPLENGDPLTIPSIKRFIGDYKPVKDSVDKVFKNLERTTEDIREGLQYVKHYYPAYKTPEKFITFIGPMDAAFEASTASYGDAVTEDALTTDAIIIGLQLHMGSKFSMYLSEMGQALYPAYISRRFAPEYIPVNTMKNIIDDIYPENTVGKSLVEKMVEKGKRLHVLDKLMPETADTLKIGYTEKQLKGCFDNEGLIWNFILANSLAFNTDPGIIKGYIGEAPNTPELGEGSPGYIGLFIGRQIVRKYAEKFPDAKLEEIMKMDARKLFEQSKYRPK